MESNEFSTLIEQGDAAAVARAIEDGMPVDATDITDNPAIVMAAMFGHEDVVKVLLDAGADFRHKNAKGKTVQDVLASARHRTDARKRMLKILQQNS